MVGCFTADDHRQQGGDKDRSSTHHRCLSSFLCFLCLCVFVCETQRERQKERAQTVFGKTCGEPRETDKSGRSVVPVPVSVSVSVSASESGGAAGFVPVSCRSRVSSKNSCPHQILLWSVVLCGGLNPVQLSFVLVCSCSRVSFCTLSPECLFVLMHRRQCQDKIFRGCRLTAHKHTHN